jgi:hypothetical protein
VKLSILDFWVSHSDGITGLTCRSTGLAYGKPVSLAVGAAMNARRTVVTLPQAIALAWATLTPEQLRLPDIQILSGDEKPENIGSYKSADDPRFLVFNAISEGTPDGSIEVGFYIVDSYTGDVFDGVSADCDGYHNKKLRALQKKIRRTLRLADSEYRKIKTDYPESAGSSYL